MRVHDVCVRRLDSNALVCDCGMMWLSDMLKDSHLQAAVTCDQPSSMAGQSLLSVLDDIVCRESPTFTLHLLSIYMFLTDTTYLTVSLSVLSLHNIDSCASGKRRYFFVTVHSQPGAILGLNVMQNGVQ